MRSHEVRIRDTSLTERECCSLERNMKYGYNPYLSIVASYSKEELLKFRGIGPKTVENIKTVLSHYGWSLYVEEFYDYSKDEQ